MVCTHTAGRRRTAAVGMLADGAEVTLGLLRAAQGVERGGGDQRVDAEALGALGLIDHAQGFHVDDAGKHGHAMVHDGHGLLQHMITLGVGEERNLARGAQEEQAVDAGAIIRLMERSKASRSSCFFSVSGMTTGGITPWNGESVMMSTLPLSFC